MGINRILDGKFEVVARVRVNGKIVQKQTTLTGSSREKAKAVLEKMKAKLRDADVAGCSLKKYFCEVLATYREKRNKVSASDISRCNLLANELGDVPINRFADSFEAYLKVLRNTPTKKTKKPPCHATVNRLIEIVRAAFNLSLALGVVKVNPITKARFPKAKERPRDRYLSFEERQRLFNAIEIHAPYLLPFIRYSLLVPSRKSELTLLKRDAYNSFTNTIYVPDSKAGIPIHKPVPEEMKDYFLNGIPAKCSWLFWRYQKKGEQYLPLGDFKRAFKKCVDKAGVVDVRIHDCRHVAASDLCAMGNSERAIMDIAGWKTPMLSTYWHKDSLRSAQTIRFHGKCENKCENIIVAVQ
jgi:integrase